MSLCFRAILLVNIAVIVPQNTRMAKRSAWTRFPMIVALFSYVACAGIVSFDFPPQTDITVDPDAYIEGDKIQLTKITPNGYLESSVGWATYDKPIPVWDNSSRALANFNTHFQFIIGDIPDVNGDRGDGITFFLAPLLYQMPKYSRGRWLGLFNESTDGISSNGVVAVEFDTYMNLIDVDDNHVGIDVNSVVSKASIPLSSEGRFGSNTLHNGKPWDAWIDYDGSRKELKVYLLYNSGDDSSKPSSPMLSYPIDLRNYVPEKVKVGLSSSTGTSEETHTILAWNFSCEYSWDLSSAPPQNNAPDNEDRRVKVILISLSVVFLVTCCFVFICRWWYLRARETRRNNEGEEGDVELDEQFDQGPRKFSYAQLSVATKDFSEDEKLGEGGFGGVYKGILPITNEAVAIKRISRESKQGKKEYASEVTIISKLRHRNLVRILGWCHEKGELLLVYELLPNGSLDKYIFYENNDRLNWDRRYSIACGVASALTYLHEEWDQCVVHRDVKASNVLLDSDFNAKLGDFGLARLIGPGRVASHTTEVAGTRGYMAPEYVDTGKASPEADVYSFGALALEIACGRRPIDYMLCEYDFSLLAWAWDLRGQGKLLDAADKKLNGNFNNEELERMMLVGFLCLHPDPKCRPTMRKVFKMLKFDTELPYVPQDLPIAVFRDASASHAGSSSVEMPSTSESAFSRCPAGRSVKGENSRVKAATHLLSY